LNRSFIRAFFTGGCFVALCAVALAIEVSIVAGVPFERLGFYLFVFFATWSSYRLHDLLQPARRWRTMLLLTATLVSACSLQLTMLPWVAVSTILSLAYSLPILPGGRRMREWGLVKIISLVGVWTIITAYLPAQGQLDTATMAMLLTRRFLFMFALCLAFDARDRTIDAQAGIRTLPVLLGDAGSIIAIRVALLTFAMLVLVKPFMTGEHQGASPMAIALVVSAVVSWLAIERVRRRPAGAFYYHSCIDGMMAMQGLLVLVASCVRFAR
jgi:4-hydroxybenzoate polyprenyltransferase